MKFITDNMTAEEAQALVDLALPLMSASGRIPWHLVEGETGIKYSRGWLIVRRAYMEIHQKDLLIDTDAIIAAAVAKDPSVDVNRKVLGLIVEDHRDFKSLSWGEIAVRLGLPESRVRSCYKALGNKKDLGLRIGKGGRHAYDDPTLYLANRRKEGAMIPADLKGKPQIEQLLNFVADDAASKPKRATKKVKVA